MMKSTLSEGFGTMQFLFKRYDVILKLIFQKSTREIIEKAKFSATRYARSLGIFCVPQLPFQAEDSVNLLKFWGQFVSPSYYRIR